MIELTRKTFWDRKDMDILCGVCSGIPLCCVTHWKEWQEFCRDHEDEEWGVIEIVRKCWEGKGYKYVPCPACLGAGRVERLIECEEVLVCLVESTFGHCPRISDDNEEEEEEEIEMERVVFEDLWL